MANAYEGHLSTLEYKIKDDSYEQQLRQLANLLLYAGKTAETKGEINTTHNFFTQMVNEISDDQYSEEYKKLEKLVFGQIENYIKKGSNGFYTFECNDICIGTLKYFDVLFSHCKNLSNSNQKWFKELIKDMNKVVTLTATKGQSKTTPKDLKHFKGENSSNIENSKNLEEEKGC